MKLKRLSLLWSAVRGDLRLAARAWRHPSTPRWFRLSLIGLAAYVISPVDILPDVLPLVGIVDDVVLVPLALRWLLRRLPTAVLR